MCYRSMRFVKLYTILYLVWTGAVFAAAEPPPGLWLELPDTRMQDVFPKEEGHPGWGVLGPRAITMAWGGAAFDTKRNMLIITGGGHTDYGGNEVYGFDLTARKWHRLTEPSPMKQAGDGLFEVVGSEAPLSSHTYDGLQYVPKHDRVFKFGGSYYRGGLSHDTRAFWFAPANNAWSRGASAPVGEIEVTSDYDEQKDEVIVGTSHGLMFYQASSNTWRLPKRDDGAQPHGVATLDPHTRRLVLVDSSHGDIFYYDIDEANLHRKKANVQGDTDWGPRPGMAYHPPSKQLVLWAGGREVWLLRSDTWTTKKYEAVQGDAPSHISANGGAKTNGIYSRWQYVPQQDAFLGYTHSTDNVWLFRLPGADQLSAHQSTVVAPKQCHADLCVGPGYQYKRPSDVARLAKDGQTIHIAAGNYDRDVAVWEQHNLTVRGVEGRPHLRAYGVAAEGKAIWVVKGNNFTVENLEFSGAAVSDNNGAAIRLEGTHLTMRHCYVHDNQTGVLTGRNQASDVLIEQSEFSGAGRTHNIYIGEIRSFTLRGSYIHHGHIGHQVKSRAAKNVIAYNRIMDESDGNSSYAIDLPEGGFALVIGNIVQQSQYTDNNTLIAYAAEAKKGFQYPRNELYVVNNTLINNLPPPHGTFVFVQRGTQRALVANNILVDGGKVVEGSAEQLNNVVLPRSDFVAPDKFDFRLRAESKAIDAAQRVEVDGQVLNMSYQYQHKAQLQVRPRRGKLDLGALEYVPE